jgi:hypothetical protein
MSVGLRYHDADDTSRRNVGRSHYHDEAEAGGKIIVQLSIPLKRRS